MRALSFVVLSLVAMSVFAQDKPYQCQKNITYPGRGTFFYDFSSLFHDSSYGVDSLMKRFDGNAMYFNPCGISSAACWTPDTTTCLRTADFEYYSGGLLTTQNITASNWRYAEVGKSAMITYTGGDSDGCNGARRSTVIHVICEPTATPPYFMDDYDVNGCKYIFYLFSATGCGTQVPSKGRFNWKW